MNIAENFPSPLETTTLVTSSSFVFNMESVAPAVGEVLRQCLEGGVFRVKLHATARMRRGDEVEDKTFRTGNIQRGVLIPVFTAADTPRPRDGDDGASARWG